MYYDRVQASQKSPAHKLDKAGELTSYDLKILRLANSRKYLRRGVFGWPLGSMTPSLEIQGLIDYGYLRFFYDWGFDRPCLKITGLGRARLLEKDG